MKYLNLHKHKLLLITLLSAVCFLSSCKKEEDIDAIDDQIIRDYIAANKLEADKTASGLYYVTEEAGTEQYPTLSNEVRVQYKGYYTDGEVFDANTLTFPLSGVISGWQEGLQKFGKGAKGKLLIPSRLGYGSNPPAGIRPDAVLIFNIYLIDIK
ncbi:FKBP-type peptidyl-prolyl cis-trans isomerase [Lentimicrobium saccharophilum]|uniref:Peptidyl-prolyl cis-trans isomerase n=1 Tax=Lentimicrobium saccharophilum TaxID=1678841 RepID=A0A0S7BPI1_9BACT|nr:FKBP-type peptidyl-prolyl cis-trans isomerase [Lentimicrobium saccharophilum]GAP42093.1 FKBP-type peptidyl-prolyl cis-trans isomerase [Lentimicrobium saccharophilum]